MSSTKRNVMLVGNGINRCFETSSSWNKMLASMSKDRKVTEETIRRIKCPAPLKAILITNDNVNSQIKAVKESLVETPPDEEIKYIRDLLSIKFDDILTTNYTYELEMAALSKSSITNGMVYRLAKHTGEVARAESKYMLHTYNAVYYNNHINRIWHIHGELRKPNSMILGHYYYAGLLGQLFEINKQRKFTYSRWEIDAIEPKYNSWFDSFILGDIYVLGFGFDLSEMDIWWLLNRKKRESAEHGKVYYYNIHEEGNSINCIIVDLLRMMDVEIIDFYVNENDWKSAYNNALLHIKDKIKTSTNQEED